MTKDRLELLGDWLIVAGAATLLMSLFLPWSHQFSRSFLTEFGSSELLRGVPRDPTAWQVYSAADWVLALLAIGLVTIALVGNRVARLVGVAGAAIALAFTIHASSHPPTNHPAVFDPAARVPSYFPNSPERGEGESVAIVGLGVALVGLAVSFTAD